MKIGNFNSCYVSQFKVCTINSTINGTPIDVHLPISKLHSILAVANALPIKTYGYVIMGK